MPYRKFDTGTWQDPWFENLDHKSKLGFVYFWTNGFCNQAGIYEITEKRILFDLGYGIDTISIPLHEKVIWYPDHKIVWIKNFFRHQCQNKNFAISALNSIRKDSFKLQVFIDYNRPYLEGIGVNLKLYHIDTISIPTIKSSTEQNRTEQIKEPPKPEKKETQKFIPQKKRTPAKNAGTFKPKNKDVKNGDYSQNLSATFLKINSLCKTILDLPKTTKRKQTFDPKKWAQKKISEKKHSRAIEKSLSGLELYWETTGDPWGYCDNILAKVNGTFNEADSISENEFLKNMTSPELSRLTSGLFKEI